MLDMVVPERANINQRVRAILLTPRHTLMLIKRVKNDVPPYWVAPGGGVEAEDKTLLDTLSRELNEELGAVADVIETAFVLEHEKAGKNLEEHFFICRLVNYDLSKRSGPEFEDPTRGQYLPVEIALDAKTINALNIKTPELRDWLLNNLDSLRQVS